MRYLRFCFFSCILATFISCESRDVVLELPGRQSESHLLYVSYAGGRDTKTMFGDFTSSGSFAEILWSPRDSIKVFTSAGSGQEGLKYVTVEGGKTAVFECKSQNQQTIPSGSLGLYPYSQDATASFASSNKIETIIPSVQRAYADTFDPCALLSVGVATAEDRMVFYNICSGICFTLQSSDYSRIVFKGANSELIAGAVSISMSKPESPSVTPVSQGAEKEIVLEAPDGGTFATDSRYYIMLRPGDFSKGFSMEFYSPNSQQPVVCTCSSFVSFKRGVFAFVSDVDNPDKLAAIRDASSLADRNGPANCYIISKAGTYKFPLVRGNDPDDALAGVSKVEVLWENYPKSVRESVHQAVYDALDGTDPTECVGNALYYCNMNELSHEELEYRSNIGETITLGSTTFYKEW